MWMMAAGGPLASVQPEATTGAAAWARRSARTLARRLRRRRVAASGGASRSQALLWRTEVFRQAVRAQWEVEAVLGAHFGSLREAAEGARLLHCLPEDEVSAFLELGDQANWARHAPPPGAVRVHRGPAQALLARDLEDFRAHLYPEPPCSAAGAERGARGGLDGE